MVCQMGREHLIALKEFQQWYPQLALLLWVVHKVHNHFPWYLHLPAAKTGLAGYQSLERMGGGSLWRGLLLVPLFSPHCEVPALQNWAGYKKGTSTDLPLVRLGVCWSKTEAQNCCALAWPGAQWASHSKPGMQLVWNTAKGPRRLTGAGLQKAEGLFLGRVKTYVHKATRYLKKKVTYYTKRKSFPFYPSSYSHVRFLLRADTDFNLECIFIISDIYLSVLLICIYICVHSYTHIQV